MLFEVSLLLQVSKIFALECYSDKKLLHKFGGTKQLIAYFKVSLNLFPSLLFFLGCWVCACKCNVL